MEIHNCKQKSCIQNFTSKRRKVFSANLHKSLKVKVFVCQNSFNFSLISFFILVEHYYYCLFVLDAVQNIHKNRTQSLANELCLLRTV